MTSNCCPAELGISEKTSHQARSSDDASSKDEDSHATVEEDEEPREKTKDEQTPEKKFEVQWDGDLDPMNPRCMSKARKWTIVMIVSAGSTCVTCTSSMYTSTYQQITTEFHVSRVVATLGLSLFVMGLGLGPLFLGPLSEFYGQ